MSTHHDKFLNPKLTPANIDSFLIRKAILAALSKQIPKFQGVLLDIGSGNQPYKHILMSKDSKVVCYIALDIIGNIYNSPDIYWDGKMIPLKDNSINCSIATEVLEHCPKPEIILEEIYRILRSEGILFFTVPFFWPLHEVPNDEYRYTPYALYRMLRSAGFTEITLEAEGGWDKALAQMLGLWARRRPMGSKKRAIISIVLFPIIKFLIYHDYLPLVFGDNLMITGISGTAKKPSNIIVIQT